MLMNGKSCLIPLLKETQAEQIFAALKAILGIDVNYMTLNDSNFGILLAGHFLDSNLFQEFLFSKSVLIAI